MNNRGFTLIEIIVSITVLSIVTAIFMQLFLRADQLMETTQQTDEAAMIAQEMMEHLYRSTDISSFLNEYSFVSNEQQHYLELPTHKVLFEFEKKESSLSEICLIVEDAATKEQYIVIHSVYKEGGFQ